MKDATAAAGEVCCRHRLVQRINQRNDTKLKRIGARLLLQSAVLAVLMTGTASAFIGEKLLPQAKVTLPQARKVALNAYPGKIVSEELEQESGGSGLRYSFVIQHKKVKHEVGVDAKTGAVLENAVEGKNPD
jgi:uncharacterized membrane protein YkoI